MEKHKLPEGWRWRQLGDFVVSLENGGRPRGGVSKYHAGIPSISAEQIAEDGTFRWDSIKYVPTEFYEAAKKGRIVLDSILIVKDGATTGKGAFIDHHFPFKQAMVNEHTYVLKTKSELLPQYVYFYLKSPYCSDFFSHSQKRGVIGGLTSDFTSQIEIPLPPLAEQKRIVKRIEELTSRVEEACTLCRQTIEETGMLTTKILGRLFGNPYKSVEGELKIASWRKMNDVVNDVADGPHITPKYVEKGVPFITVLNITSGRIVFNDYKCITEEDHRRFQQRARAQRGDVLISKDGTLGIPCYVDTDTDFSFFVSVALVKPKREILDGEFLTWAIRAPYLQEQIQARSRGDMIRHLVLREIRDLTVPVLSLLEQRRIVAYLDSLQIKKDALKRAHAEIAADLAAFTPALLAKAFRGAL